MTTEELEDLGPDATVVAAGSRSGEVVRCFRCRAKLEDGSRYCAACSVGQDRVSRFRAWPTWALIVQPLLLVAAVFVGDAWSHQDEAAREIGTALELHRELVGALGAMSQLCDGRDALSCEASMISRLHRLDIAIHNLIWSTSRLPTSQRTHAQLARLNAWYWGPEDKPTELEHRFDVDRNGWRQLYVNHIHLAPANVDAVGARSCFRPEPAEAVIGWNAHPARCREQRSRIRATSQRIAKATTLTFCGLADDAQRVHGRSLGLIARPGYERRPARNCASLLDDDARHLQVPPWSAARDR